MDMFVQDTQSAKPTAVAPEYCPPGIVLDYYDGNTVTALWNYAQYYSMSDNNWDTTFGPSTPGALNVTSGSTAAPRPSPRPGHPEPAGGLERPEQQRPRHDVRRRRPVLRHLLGQQPHHHRRARRMSGQNIGDLLNAKHVTWGWFQGGFAPTSTDSTGSRSAARPQQHRRATVGRLLAAPRAVPVLRLDGQPDHLPPRSLSKIGYTDQANHQYDIS